jgi:hypothetical protein
LTGASPPTRGALSIARSSAGISSKRRTNSPTTAGPTERRQRPIVGDDLDPRRLPETVPRRPPLRAPPTLGPVTSPTRCAPRSPANPAKRTLPRGPDGPPDPRRIDLLRNQGQTCEALSAILRSGNAGANTAADHVTVLDRALEQIPACHIEVIEILVRADSAGATHALADHCHDGSMRFSFGYELTESVRAAILEIPEDA